LQPQAQKKGLLLRLDSDLSSPTFCEGDPGRLRQVLTNLIGNAIKFTAQGEVVLEVRLVALTENRVTLRFSVQDSGIGIPSDRISGLFQKFTQVDPSTTRRFGGTGLGLAISRELVELMGGRIGVRSEFGRGSEFWFTVCLAIDPRQMTERHFAHHGAEPLGATEPTALTESAVSTPTQTSPVTVLLAEDNETNQLVAAGMLARLGIKVDIAGTGHEAIEALRKRRYPLVLMDVQMPDMDGIEATTLIRSGAAMTLDPAVPIVAMTAHVMQEERQRCLDAQMNDHLAKPIVSQRLQAVLDKWLTETPASENGQSSFDYSELLARLNGDRELLTKVLVAFRSDLPGRVAQLERCLRAGDTTKGTLEAHSLKGASATVGANAIRDIAIEVETACRQGDIAKALLFLPPLRAKFDALAVDLKSYLAS
jgi:CheY-like chemotaxis protein